MFCKLQPILFFVFLSYNNDQAVKNHPLDQTNSMARIKSARALLDKTRSSQNVKFANFSALAGCERGFRARALLVRATEFVSS